MNAALHLGVCGLLFLLARRLALGVSGAAVAALLFAVLPVHTEAIANVVGRAELLAALFGLIALLSWGAGGRRGSWGAAGAVLLALGSKEVAVVVPPLLVLWDLLRRRGSGRAWWIERAGSLAPVGLAVVVWLVLRTVALETFLAPQTVHPVDNPLQLLDQPSRTATALGLAARAARLMVWPTGLSIDYSGGVIEPVAGLLSARALAGAAVLLLAVAAIARGLRHPAGRGSAIAMSGALFLLPYLVVANLLVIVGAIFAERFLYLPSAGPCLAAGIAADVAWARARAGRARVALAAVAGIVLVAMAAAAHARSRHWRDDTSIFAETVRTQPRSPRAHAVMARMHADAGRLEEALRELDTVTTVWPAYAMAWFEKGTLLGRLGRLEEAERALRQYMRLSPTYGSAHFNLALVLRRQGRTAEAERALRKAVLHDPGLHRAWAELGHLRFEQGRYREAAEAYSRAVALGRSDLAGRRDAAVRAAAAPP